ncbi:MAG: hypothetical protein WC413_02535 [Candidatus Nanoarchaeia archaeon]
MNCRLCELVENMKVIKEPGKIWTKEIDVEDSMGVKRNLILTGRLYEFPDNKREIIRYMDDNFIFVNPVKDYSQNYADIIIGLPKEHVTNMQFSEKFEMFSNLYKRAMELVKHQYDVPGSEIGARIMMNYEKKYATVVDHSHIQIILTQGTMTLIPEVVRKY